MTRLLLLAYGRPTEYARAVFAALSAWAWSPAVTGQLEAIILTDNPAAFEPWLQGLPVQYWLLTPERMAELRGPQHYTFRLKPCMLAEAARAYPADDLLFVDADTFFFAPAGLLLQGLAAGHSYLHQPEYRLAEAGAIHDAFGEGDYPRRALALLAGRSFRVQGAEVRFQPEQQSWNSGVIGLPTRLTPLLPDVLALNDALYAASEWFTSEQVAFSLVLPTAGPLTAAEHVVYHYWRKAQKEVVDQLLADTLTADFAALPLRERLAHLRQLTQQWHRQLELHRTQQDALYAIGTGQLAAGVKCATKALLAAPLHKPFLRALARAIRTRATAGAA